MLEKAQINTFAEIAGKPVVMVCSELGKTTQNKSKTVEIMTDNIQKFSSKRPLRAQLRTQDLEVYGQDTSKGTRAFQGVGKEL